VRLGAPGGASLVLVPLRYEFPDSDPEDGEPEDEEPADGEPAGWDANWLVVRGDVRTSGGRSWTFTHPCLTTWEARTLGGWLRDVAVGAVDPVPSADASEDRLLTFTEPLLGLSLAGREATGATVRVHLSHEALPPGAAGQGAGPTPVHVLEVHASVRDLSAAADEWERELAPFPVR
jgi:hypothetical protein